MTDRHPTQTRNLDRYGNPEVPWSRAHDLLESGPHGPVAGYFLATVDPDGQPHTTGVGVVWHDGDLYFTSSPGTRKSRNLDANPACAFAVKLPGMDLTLEGKAPELQTLQHLRRSPRGPPPWNLYRFSYRRIGGLSTAEPNGATL